MNRRARAGACCVSRVAACPSLCNVALLVEAWATRRADHRPWPSGRRRATRGPRRTFVLILASGFSLRARPAHRIRHSGSVPVPPQLFVEQGAGPNIITSKIFLTFPYAGCFFVFFFFLLPRNATGRPTRRTATPHPLRRAVLRAPFSRWWWLKENSMASFPVSEWVFDWKHMETSPNLDLHWVNLGLLFMAYFCCIEIRRWEAELFWRASRIGNSHEDQPPSMLVSWDYRISSRHITPTISELTTCSYIFPVKCVSYSWS